MSPNNSKFKIQNSKWNWASAIRHGFRSSLPMLAFLIFNFAFLIGAAAQTYTATLTVTNLTPTTNGTGILLLQGRTLQWSNATPASLLLKPLLIPSTNNLVNTATNLFGKLTNSFGGTLFYNMSSPTGIVLRAPSATPLTVQVSNSWASVSFVTNWVQTNFTGSIDVSNVNANSIRLNGTNITAFFGGGGGSTYTNDSTVPAGVITNGAIGTLLGSQSAGLNLLNKFNRTMATRTGPTKVMIIGSSVAEGSIGIPCVWAQGIENTPGMGFGGGGIGTYNFHFEQHFRDSNENGYSADTNWVGFYTGLAHNSWCRYTNGGFFNANGLAADSVGLFWLSTGTTNAFTLMCSTNGGPYGTLAVLQQPHARSTLEHTNFSMPLSNYRLMVSNTGPNIAWIVGPEYLNSTISNGVAVYLIQRGGETLSDISLCIENLTNAIGIIQPDLIWYASHESSALGWTNGLSTLQTLLSYSKNPPLILGEYEIDADTNRVSQPSLTTPFLSEASRSNKWAFYDLHFRAGGYVNQVAKGWMQDTAHFSGTGANVMVQYLMADSGMSPKAFGTVGQDLSFTNTLMTALSNTAVSLSVSSVRSGSNSISRAAYSVNLGQVSTVVTSSGSEQRIAVSDDVAITAAGTNISVLSLTNRAIPKVVATLNTSTNIHFITSAGQFFYVVGDGFLNVYNCAVPSLPVRTTNFNLGTLSAVKASSKDGLLIVCGYASGLATPGLVKIFSISNPSMPVLISTISCGAGSGIQDAVKRGDLLYIADYFGRTIKVADISNPSAPVIVHSQAAQDHGDGDTFEPWTMFVKDNALFVGDDGWLQIFNLNTATNPVFVSATNVSDDVEGTALNGDLLIWGSSTGQLMTFDLIDPFNPAPFASTNTSWTGAQFWMTSDGGYIYHTSDGSLNILNQPRLTRFGTARTEALLISITNAVILPIASNNVGRVLTAKVTGNVTNVLSTIGLDRIELAATKSLTNGQSITLQSDGTTNWFEIGRKSESSGVVTNALQLGGNPSANFVTNTQSGATLDAPNFTGVIVSTNLANRLALNAPTNAPVIQNEIHNGTLTANTNSSVSGLVAQFNGKVGINTNAPTDTLQVRGTFSAGNNRNMTVDTSGNVQANSYNSADFVGLGRLLFSGGVRVDSTDGSTTRYQNNSLTGSASMAITNNGFSFIGSLQATNLTTFSTNTLTFTTVSSCTNTLGCDATASISAGTTVILQDRFGNTVDTIGTIATIHILVPMRANMRLSGTGVSCVIY